MTLTVHGVIESVSTGTPDSLFGLKAASLAGKNISSIIDVFQGLNAGLNAGERHNLHELLCTRPLQLSPSHTFVPAMLCFRVQPCSSEHGQRGPEPSHTGKLSAASAWPWPGSMVLRSGRALLQLLTCWLACPALSLCRSLLRWQLVPLTILASRGVWAWAVAVVQQRKRMPSVCSASPSLGC